MSQLGFISDALYSLKNEYGQSIDIYKIEALNQNITTGVKSVSKTKYTIKAIVLPNTQEKLLKPTNPSIRQTNHFVSSGFDLDIKEFLIQRKDLNFELTNNEYIVNKHKRYDIIKITYLDDEDGYHVIAKNVKGSLPFEIFNLTIKHKLALSQSIHHD